MDKKTLSALIDTYTLADCMALLAAFAPDLLSDLSNDIRLRPDDPSTLDKARRAVRFARARENN